MTNAKNVTNVANVYDVYVYRPEGGIDTPDLSGEPWCATFVGHEQEGSLPVGPSTPAPILCCYFCSEADALAFQRLWRESVGLPVDMPNERGET